MTAVPFLCLFIGVIWIVVAFVEKNIENVQHLNETIRNQKPNAATEPTMVALFKDVVQDSSDMKE